MRVPAHTEGMTSRLRASLTPADLPLTELNAAVLDGVLYPRGFGFACIDEPDDPANRAESLTIPGADRLIIERRSAAWVWGALPQPPAVHQLCSSSEARAMARPSSPEFVLREVLISPREIVNCGTSQVTTPLRTAVDLLVTDTGTQTPDVTITALLTLAELTFDDCIALLRARRNLPGKARALARLRALSPLAA